MMPLSHLMWALPAALLYFLITQEVYSSFAFLLTAVFIDIDHVLDYILAYGKFDIKYFLRGRWFKKKLYVIFHSYELVLILLFVYFQTNNSLVLAIALGITYHFITDMVYYKSELKKKILFYSLIYRMSQKFEKKVFCSG
ncbi:hypothetical protein GF361_04035 [Candidatus Woesearchaeota archaeon]|nr:hypothetical protein [Candidatus Woesearchaeota archaeon]